MSKGAAQPQEHVCAALRMERAELLPKLYLQCTRVLEKILHSCYPFNGVKKGSWTQILWGEDLFVFIQIRIHI